MAGYVKELFITSGLDVNVGLVQTAYSNGNSTKYVTDELVCILHVSLYSYCYYYVLISEYFWNKTLHNKEMKKICSS